ncbi:MAG: 3'-5' exoribonuclease [Planctomycetia bacterium]|nr:3'-5' exoribonuclease [Planctomycetia bacterium]
MAIGKKVQWSILRFRATATPVCAISGRIGSRNGWPVRYNADRDCRTLFDLAYPHGGIPVDDEGVAHNSLDDAVGQARAVQACVRKLRGQG